MIVVVVFVRFWLMDCSAAHESVDMATRLYAEASLVPYMGKFVVFTKRLDTDEALVRCFCVTDDKVDKVINYHIFFTNLIDTNIYLYLFILFYL